MDVVPASSQGSIGEVFLMVRLPSVSTQPKGYWHKIFGGPNLAVLQASFMSVLAGVEVVFPVTFYLLPEESGFCPQVNGEVVEMEWLDKRRVNLTLDTSNGLYQIRDYNHVAFKGDLAVMELDGYVRDAKKYPPRYEVDEDVLKMVKDLRSAINDITHTHKGGFIEEAMIVLQSTRQLAKLMGLRV